MSGLIPGNAFRIVVDCAKFTANLEYGPLEMEDSRHEVLFDSRSVQSFLLC